MQNLQRLSTCLPTVSATTAEKYSRGMLTSAVSLVNQCNRHVHLGCASQVAEAAVQSSLSIGPSDCWRSVQLWRCCFASGPGRHPPVPGSGTPAPAVAWAPLQHVNALTASLQTPKQLAVITFSCSLYASIDPHDVSQGHGFIGYGYN